MREFIPVIWVFATVGCFTVATFFTRGRASWLWALIAIVVAYSFPFFTALHR